METRRGERPPAGIDYGDNDEEKAEAQLDIS